MKRRTLLTCLFSCRGIVSFAFLPVLSCIPVQNDGSGLASLSLSASPAVQQVGADDGIELALVVPPALGILDGTPVILEGLDGNDRLDPPGPQSIVEGRWSARVHAQAAGDRALRASVAGLPSSAAVTWQAARPDVGRSQVAVAPSAVQVDEPGNVAVTVRVRDRFGNAVAGEAVSLQLNAIIGALTLSGQSDSSGQFTVAMQSTLAESLQLSTRFAGAGEVATATFLPGPADANRSRLVQGSGGPLDTSTAIALHAAWCDRLGNPVSGKQVSFSVLGSEALVSPEVATTDANGFAHTTLSVARAQSLSLLARIGEQTVSTTLSILPAPSSMVLTPNQVVYQPQRARVSAQTTLRDQNGRLLRNEPVRIGIHGDQGGRATPAVGRSDPNGQFLSMIELNRSGPQDIVATTASQRLVSRLSVQNNGNSNRTPMLSAAGGPASVQPTDAVLADLNHDGKVDLLLASQRLSSVFGLLSASASALGTNTDASTSLDVIPLAVALVDTHVGEEDDLLVVSGAPTTLVRYAGVGSGRFDASSANELIASSSACPGLLTFDLFQSGHRDIVLTCQTPNGLQVIRNRGDKGFSEPKAYDLGGLPTHTTVADVNGDGRHDLLVSNASSPNVSLLLGAPNETFIGPYAVVVNANTFRVEAVDLDGDGRTDIAFTSGDDAYSDSFGYVLAAQDGTFGAPAALASCRHPAGLAAGYFSSTSRRDLLVSCATTLLDAARLYPLQGGVASAALRQQSLFLGPYRSGLVTGDFNLDGFTDVVPTLNEVGSSSDSTSLFFGSPSGLVAPVPVSVSKAGIGNRQAIRGMAMADVDGDGDLDVISTNNSNNRVDVNLNQNGTLLPSMSFACSTSPSSEPSLADVDGDGKVDLVVASASVADLVIWLGNGDGTFRQGPTVATGFATSGATFGLLDGDLYPSLIAASATDGQLQVWANDGRGGFALKQALATAPGSASLRLADFNGDGNTDLYMFASAGGLIAGGSGAGRFAAITVLGTPPVDEQVFASVADFNGDGLADVFDTTLSLGRGGLPVIVGPGPFGSRDTRVRMSLAEDLNGDGQIDLVLAATSLSSILAKVLKPGGIPLPETYSLAPISAPGAMAAGDLDGDGMVDLVYGSAGSQAFVDENDASEWPAHLVVAPNRSLTFAPVP